MGWPNQSQQHGVPGMETNWLRQPSPMQSSPPKVASQPEMSSPKQFMSSPTQASIEKMAVQSSTNQTGDILLATEQSVTAVTCVSTPTTMMTSVSAIGISGEKKSVPEDDCTKSIVDMSLCVDSQNKKKRKMTRKRNRKRKQKARRRRKKQKRKTQVPPAQHQ